LCSKHSLKSVPYVIVSWSFFFITSIFCIPMFFIEDLSHINTNFFIYLGLQTTLFGVSSCLYMRAISLSPLSITVPLVMFTPVYLLILSPFTVKEWPSLAGICGTVLIVAGSYVLNIRSVSKGLFEPIKALLREPGPKLMLVVSIIWSMTSTIDKLAITECNAPLFWSISIYFSISIILTILLISRKKTPYPFLKNKWKILIPIGIFNAFQLTGYSLAVQAGPIAYVLAIKRTSILIVVVLGSIIFNDTKLSEKLPAVIIMLGGVILILLT
jgi:drug/metabolite transporter (DMT)-like permease